MYKRCNKPLLYKLKLDFRIYWYICWYIQLYFIFQWNGSKAFLCMYVYECLLCILTKKKIRGSSLQKQEMSLSGNSVMLTLWLWEVVLFSHSVVSNSLMDCILPDSPVYGISWARILENYWKIGVGCHVLLRGIFPTKGSNLHLLHWQADFFLIN